MTEAVGLLILKKMLVGDIRIARDCDGGSKRERGEGVDGSLEAF